MTPEPAERDAALVRAEEVLAHYGRAPLDSMFAGLEGRAQKAAAATALMDLFRCTGEGRVFDCLVELVRPDLMARVRARLRGFCAQFDPHEVLQDTLVNIFRYPDRFVPSRYNAFGAWSAAIVDNAIRRMLRGQRSGPRVALSPIEILTEHVDHRTPQPDRVAAANEEVRSTASAYGLFLVCYLTAFASLSDRERFVLQMVEVRRMRYAELGRRLGIRPEAIKMVVFRARRRVFERISVLLQAAGAGGDCVAAA